MAKNTDKPRSKPAPPPSVFTLANMWLAIIAILIAVCTLRLWILAEEIKYATVALIDVAVMLQDHQPIEAKQFAQFVKVLQTMQSYMVQ